MVMICILYLFFMVKNYILMRNLLRALTFLFVFSGSLLAQDFNLNDITKQIPIDPKIRIGQLENGLTYYIKYNQRPENKVELRLAVNTGSLMEDDDQLGLAHFTEHMAFNGSEHFDKNELLDYVQSVGVQFGAHINAYTSFDETVYMLPIASDSAEILENAFLILEDWADGLSFDHEEIEKERGVVVEEWVTTGNAWIYVDIFFGIFIKRIIIGANRNGLWRVPVAGGENQIVWVTSGL